MKVEIKESKVLDVTPKLLAQIFWEFDHQEQANFFHYLAAIAGENIEPQIYHAVFFADTSPECRQAMRDFGENLVKAEQ